MLSPQPLSGDHELDLFECGIPALDECLKRWARRNEVDRASRTFVTCVGRRVIGYYGVATASILHEVATGKIRRNMPDPVPAILLGRLAVDRHWQAQGRGGDLLAVLRALGAAETARIRAMLVRAISDQKRRSASTKSTAFAHHRSNR